MRNKKMKRLLAMIICTGLLASTLTGCGQKAETGGSTSSSSKSQESEASKTQEPSGTEEEGGGDYFPLEEQKTITIAGVRADTGVAFQDTEYFKESEKRTNVKVEWIDWPQSIQKEKSNLAFSSGQLPDAFYGSWVFLTKEDALKYGSEGLLKDMSEYFTPEIMPNFTQLLADVPDLKTSLSTADGKVYSLSTLDMNATNLTNDILAINSDWLKQVNKEMPTTIDELFEVLVAFKEAGDLNGNGKADEIPLTFKYNEGNMGLFSLMGFTGIPIQDKNSRMVIKDGKPEFHPAIDEYKEYISYLNKLYSNGLIDPEAFTMDSPTYNAKTQAKTPVAGVISQWSLESLNKPMDGFDTAKDGVYLHVAPLKGPSGKDPKWTPRTTPLNGNLSFGINAKSDNAELAARWIDLAFAEGESIKTYLGVVGTHLKDEGDGKYSRMKKEDGKDFTSEDKYPIIPNKFAVAFIKPGEYAWTDDVVSVQNKKASDQFYQPYLYADLVDTSGYPTEEENERLKVLMPDLFEYADQMTAQFITKGGIEEGWNAYIEQLKKLNMEEYVQIKTDIHNRSQK